MSFSRIYRDLIKHLTGDTQYEMGKNLSIAYRSLSRPPIIIILSILALTGISSCAREPTPYMAPTIIARATPLLLASTVPVSTSQPNEPAFHDMTPLCFDSLTLLEDLTVPERSTVKPGERLDKRWLVQNSGTCNWDERYQLKLISGEDMGAAVVQALYPARNGTKATLRILFSAPSDPGIYQSEWQAHNPQGQAFGDSLKLQLVVADSTRP